MILVLVGAAIVALTVLSALGTIVVPRAVPVRLARIVASVVRQAVLTRMKVSRNDDRREAILAWHAPVSLVLLVFCWLAAVVIGFTFVFRGLGVESWAQAFELSGSSMTTLGFVAAETMPQHAAAFLDAAVGLLLLALLITYLPTVYSGFQRREVLVARVASQAGTPPDGVQLLTRFHLIRGLDELADQVWEPWIDGFIDVEETHTSLTALAHFRSPVPQRSWVTANGAVLDAAALLASTVDAPRQPAAELCIRAGYLSLRRIADAHGIPYDPAPRRDDPILVRREEWEAARSRLADAGLPVRADVDEAWRDFAGWRVNYDDVLVGLAELVAAPPAPWSSDRTRHHGGRQRQPEG